MTTLKAKVNGVWVPISAGGGDEFFVGAATPPDPYELWYDTDAPAIGSSASLANPYNALGIVAVGTMLQTGGPWTLPASTLTQTTNAINITLAIGRRYRVRFYARAFTTQATASNIAVMLRNGSTSMAINEHVFAPPPGQFGFIYGEWLLSGDGGAKGLNVSLESGVAISVYTESQALFYVEDVGPTAVPALPLPDTPVAWTPLTLTNGWVFAGGVYPPPTYRKIGDMVHIRGGISNPAAMANPSTSNCAQLPVGFRSPYNINAPAIGIGSDNWGAVSLLTVLNTGVLQVIRNAGPSVSPHVLTQFDFQFSVTP